jgi:hypothetical protein
MKSDKIDGERTILGNMLDTIDPVTGEKLSYTDVVANSNGLM